MEEDEEMSMKEIEDHIQISERHKVLSVRQTFVISLNFCMLWFIANYFYNAGLVYTLVSSSTILSNTSVLFVFIFSSLLIKDERFSLLKLVGVLVSFGGATTIALSDSNVTNETAKHRLLGDLLTLVSAIAYGAYSTFLKIKIPEEYEQHFDMGLFFGFVGLINIVLLSPVVLLCHLTGFETFELPNSKTLLFLSVNAFLGSCISDYCWAKSVIILGPLFTQLGISLTIPLGILATSLFDKVDLNAGYFIGTALIFVAFIGVNIVHYFETQEKLAEKAKCIKFREHEMIRMHKTI